MTKIGQNSRPLLLCIFLALLAIDAVAGMRECIESLERDLVAALMTLSERVRGAIQATQRFVDVPEEPSLLAREEERLLTLHGVRALIRHMERVAAQIAVSGLRRRAE